jgi:hypothetical protein
MQTEFANAVKTDSKSRHSDLKDRVCVTEKHTPLSPII